MRFAKRVKTCMHIEQNLGLVILAGLGLFEFRGDRNKIPFRRKRWKEYEFYLGSPLSPKRVYAGIQDNRMCM